MFVSETGVQPLMYGYMRVAEDMPDANLIQVEQALRHFAAVEGFCFATFFYEYAAGSHGVFSYLVEELRRNEAHHVVVPSLNHLARSRLLVVSMMECLSLAADAHVWTLRSSTFDVTDPAFTCATS